MAAGMGWVSSLPLEFGHFSRDVAEHSCANGAASSRVGAFRAYPGNNATPSGDPTPTGLWLKAQGWPASGLPWEHATPSGDPTPTGLWLKAQGWPASGLPWEHATPSGDPTPTGLWHVAPALPQPRWGSRSLATSTLGSPR